MQQRFGNAHFKVYFQIFHFSSYLFLPNFRYCHTLIIYYCLYKIRSHTDGRIYLLGWLKSLSYSVGKYRKAQTFLANPMPKCIHTQSYLPGKNTGVGCHFLLQGLNLHLLCLLHCRLILHNLNNPAKKSLGSFPLHLGQMPNDGLVYGAFTSTWPRLYLEIHLIVTSLVPRYDFYSIVDFLSRAHAFIKSRLTFNYLEIGYQEIWKNFTF